MNSPNNPNNPDNQDQFQETDDLPLMPKSTPIVHQEDLVRDREVTSSGYVFIFFILTFFPTTLVAVLSGGGLLEWVLGWLFSTLILASVFRIVTLLTNSSIIFEKYDIE